MHCQLSKLARISLPEKLAEYSAAAAPTVKAFGKEFIQREKFLCALAEDPIPHGLGIIQFP